MCEQQVAGVVEKDSVKALIQNPTSESKSNRRPSYADIVSHPSISSEPASVPTTQAPVASVRPSTVRLSARTVAKEADEMKDGGQNKSLETDSRNSRRRNSHHKKDKKSALTSEKSNIVTTEGVTSNRPLSYSQALKSASPEVPKSSEETELSSSKNVDTRQESDSHVAGKKALWQKKADSHKQTQSKNPFREGGAKETAGAAPKPGDSTYGKPGTCNIVITFTDIYLLISFSVEGTLTAERAAKAADWVTQEINKLISVIERIGSVNGDGKTFVCFGPLFYAYQDISDTLVGIMMRAKKRKLISYPGME